MCVANDLILGLDISTACTGIAVLGVDGSLVDLHAVDTRRHKSLWVTADVISVELGRVSQLGSYRALYIEESLQRFRSGFSSAHTLSTLAKINGIVSYAARTVLGIDPTYVSSARARAACGIKIRRAQTQHEKRDQRFTKQQVFDQMVANHPQLASFQWPLTRPSKQHVNGRLKDSCFDMLDAYVVAYSGLIVEQSKVAG